MEKIERSPIAHNSHFSLKTNDAHYFYLNSLCILWSWSVYFMVVRYAVIPFTYREPPGENRFQGARRSLVLISIRTSH